MKEIPCKWLVSVMIRGLWEVTCHGDFPGANGLYGKYKSQGHQVIISRVMAEDNIEGGVNE